MKKKDYFWSLLTIVMIAMLSLELSSCGDDDDDDVTSGGELVDKLQGTWQFQKGTEKVMGMTITMDRSSLSQMKSSMEQMMGSRVEFWDETLSFSGSKVNGVNYTLDGNKIILDGMDAMDGISISVKSVTSSTLVLREAISMEGIDLTADMEYHKDAVDIPSINPGNDDDNQGQMTTGYTATKKVQKMTLNGIAQIFYEDYNRSYKICLTRGKVEIHYSVRKGGEWWWSDSSDLSLCGIKDMGKFSGISSITSKSVTGSENYQYNVGGAYGFSSYAVDFQPNHGYAVMFTTEDNVKMYMRVYADSYTLDSNHNLETITIQYQLY